MFVAVLYEIETNKYGNSEGEEAMRNDGGSIILGDASVYVVSWKRINGKTIYTEHAMVSVLRLSANGCHRRGKQYICGAGVTGVAASALLSGSGAWLWLGAEGVSCSKTAWLFSSWRESLTF